MSAGLLLHIPGGSDTETALSELTRFLTEEAEGLFTHVFPEEAVRESWAAVVRELDPERLPVSVEMNDAPTKSPVSGDLGSAFVTAFSRQNGDAIRDVLRATMQDRAGGTATIAVFSRQDGSDSLHYAVANPSLPEHQRRDMLRCMYAILFGISGRTAVSLSQFDSSFEAAEQEDRSTTGFEELSAEVGTPGSLTFNLWNDCLALLRARRTHAVVGGDSGEAILEAGAEIVAVFREAPEGSGGNGRPHDEENVAGVLVLANTSSEVAEARIDQRVLPNNLLPAMTDLLSGDTVFVPPSGDHILSLDLEPYEVLWLELVQAR